LKRYDLTVVGAGPAGVASAVVARQAGLRVCLVDGETEGALKAGESLPGAALRTLRRLGIPHLKDLLEPDEYKPCAANVAAWGTDEWTFKDALSNPEGGGFHLLRHRFDARLRDHAASMGVEVLPGRVTQVNGEARKEPPWELLVSGTDGQTAVLRSRFLVDATGRAASLGRRLGVTRRRISEQLAVAAWFRHPEGDVDDTTRIRSVEDGWWYTARLPRGLRVVAYHGLPGDVARLVREPALFVSRFRGAGLLSCPPEEPRLVSPPKSMDAGILLADRAGGEGWLSVGDAALSFDPLSSQGMLFALYSGIRGGEAATQALARPETAGALLLDYQRRVASVFDANQRARRLFYESERRYPRSPYWMAQRGGWESRPPAALRAAC
jgi:flavin-dependent dehydrogenase